MRGLAILAPAAALIGLGAIALLFSGGGAQLAEASHGIFNAHVHDDYFHPTGSFVVGPNHSNAQALCMGAAPHASCTATVHAGDSVNWVAPAPLAANPHSVTECADPAWTVCGAGSAAGNPIEDSGIRLQPGWPYVVNFPAIGTYYYRCEVHPTTMLGIVQVVPVEVGGTVEQLTGAETPAQPDANGGSSLTLWLIAGAAGVVAIGALGLAGRRLAARRARGEE